MPLKHALAMSVAAAAVLALAPSAQAEDDPVVLDEVSVTATRAERPTKDVPQSISVIDEEEIEAQKMLNIKDALESTPGVLIESENAGYDARLIIRGAGLKARYGIREIMMLRDGVPMTDPDSFTRLDFIDTQDIERIEVVKGPGSIYATGSAGGTVQIISKSVFDLDNRVKLGAGDYGQVLGHARVGGMVTDSQALSVSATHKRLDNDWRLWNEFDSSHVALKHGAFVGEGVLESEVAYTEADLQLPGSMDEALFREFKATGTQEETSSPWKHSGRYSKILFANLRYEQEFGDWTIKPRLYGTWWEHFHPVTGFINDSDNNYVFGGDLEGHWRHEVAAVPGTLVMGATLRRDISKGAEKYTYADVDTVTHSGWSGSYDEIIATLSDRPGELAEVQDTYNTLYGVFAQESLRLSDSLLLDVGFRLDRSEFDITETEYIGFDYANTAYDDHSGSPTVTESAPGFTLFSPKIGLSWEVADGFSLYGSVAQAGQVPSSSEITSNPDLDNAVSTNYEVGAKARWSRVSFDAALYYNLVEDEIVQQRQDGESVYLNAGETEKIGFELSGAVEVLDGLTLGGGYAYSDYEFAEFSEIVYGPGGGTNVSRAGNELPFIPKHRYSLFANYRHDSGFKARVETRTWGEYWMDNANTEKYGGYDFVTDVMIGYETGPHAFQFNVDNVFDDHYAVEATKDLSGDKEYEAAPPRTWMITYRYRF